MGWKIFAVAFGCITLSAILSTVSGKYHGTVAILSLILNLFATAGLVIYAFRLNFRPSTFWRGFSVVYAAFSVFSLSLLALGVFNKIADGRMTVAVALGVIAVPAALQFFSWLPNHRLSLQRSPQ